MSLRRRMMMGQNGETDPAKMYLTFKALESGTFSFSRNAISYSLNGGSTWTSLPASTATPTIAAGQEICWKASGLTPATTNGIGTFSSTGLFDAFGNIMSMQAGDDFKTATTMASYHFSRLFYQNAKIVDASNLILPATPTAYCYYTMFMSCTALTNAPKLPATTLATDCYEQMFRGCTALTNAPELPATMLSGNCYYRMFYGCSRLNYIKCLATNISASNALYQWVQGVASKGTFIANPNTSWSTGASGIPTNWARKSSVDYTRLLYSLYDYSTDGTEATAIDTGVKLFDGSLTGYRLEIDAVLTEIPSTYAGFVSCWGTTDNHQLLLIQGVADSTGDYNDIQIALRPLISGRTVIPTLGDGDILLGYVEGNLNKVRYDLTTGADNIYRSDYATGTTQPHDSHLYVGKDPNNRYTKMVVNALRIFEIPTP